MRAFVMKGFGSPTEATIGELPAPQCGSDDILVRVAAAGVNPTDWKEMAGHLTAFYPPYEPHWAPGFDVAGLVEQAGSNVVAFKPGDSVIVLSDRRRGQSGSFAEWVRADHRLAAHAPASISLTQAASIPVAGLTAYQGLFRSDMGNAKPSQTVLIHGGSGGIGSFATSFAVAAGLNVAVTCREANAPYMKSLGAQLTIDYTNANVLETVQGWRSHGVDIVIDATSGGSDASLLDAVAPGGRLVVVATVTDDGDLAALDKLATSRRKSIHLLFIDIETVAQDLAAIARLVDGGAKMPEITCYSLDRAGEALQAMRAGRTRGKRVVEVTYLDRLRG
jgi:NADPH2:quinone reductase